MGNGYQLGEEKQIHRSSGLGNRYPSPCFANLEYRHREDHLSLVGTMVRWCLIVGKSIELVVEFPWICREQDHPLRLVEI